MSTSQGFIFTDFFGAETEGSQLFLSTNDWIWGFFPLFSVLISLFPAPARSQGSDKGLIEWQWPGDSCRAGCSSGPPAEGTNAGTSGSVVWAGAAIPHWMGAQRKAAKSMEGSSGSKGNLHWEGQLQIFQSCQSVMSCAGEGSVLSREKHGGSGSTSTRILANLPQCQLRLWLRWC